MADFVIIGAGECGVRAAFSLREQGFEGSIILLGGEHALPYERPPLSKTIGAPPKTIRAEADYHEAGIDLRLGCRVEAVEAAGHIVCLANGERLRYDRLLLATGASARLFAGMEGCLTLRTAADADRIMAHFKPDARIGIVGGGFIGLELAATARKAGADVTVVEAGPRILGRAVPGQLACIVHARHEAEGVRLLTGASVSSDYAGAIRLSDGSKLEFDGVIAGVGSLPNTQLAQAAGLTVENGIVVDGNFATSDADIFAAGDCCSFPWQGQQVRLESWKAAQDQASHAAAAMLGISADYRKVPWFWSDQYDLTLQVSGLFDQAREIHRRAMTDGSLLVFQCDGDARLRAAAGIGTGNAVARDIRIFEKLIERGGSVDATALADPAFNLKQLLKAN